MAKKSTIRKLGAIANSVECSMMLYYNDHKAVYEAPETYYKQEIFDSEDYAKLDFTKGIWDIRIYDKTPIGFYSKISNDLDEVVDWGYNLLKDLKKEAAPAPAPKFKVMMQCSPDCDATETYEPQMVRDGLYDDAEEAIKRSTNARDRDHTSWVEIVEVV